jgi:hypothetical protein
MRGSVAYVGDLVARRSAPSGAPGEQRGDPAPVPDAPPRDDAVTEEVAGARRGKGRIRRALLNHGSGDREPLHSGAEVVSFLSMVVPTRFPIKFDPPYAVLSKALRILPSDSYVEVTETQVSVRMGWAFRATFDRSRVARTSPLGKRIRLTRGVHGWAGRWLVNGAGDGVLAIDLEPRQRAYVVGVPVQLRQLHVSVDNPPALAAALAN